MIEELRIRDLGVIAGTSLSLAPGLTVLTGETGAGKTMVVTALGLLLGGRGDPGAVRPGAPAAVVEGVFRVDPAGGVAARAREAGAELDDDALLASRTVPVEGRARAHAGGRAVPLGVLAELLGSLVTVHGQSDQLRLRSATAQRRLLDAYTGAPVATALARYREARQEWLALSARLAEVTASARERSQEAELLRLGVEEIERLAPEAGEDAALEAEWGRLAHAAELRQGAEHARVALASEDVTQSEPGAVSLVGEARAALEAVRGHDTRAAELADRLAELAYLAADLATDVAAYAGDVDADPGRLAAVEQRRHELSRVVRTHGDVAAALAWADEARRRLAELGDETLPERLREQVAAAGARVAELGTELREARRGGAERLGAAVARELAALALPRARLVVDVREAEPGPDGADEVEIMLAAHSGAQPRPVARAASGGELSRVMLAIEVVTAAADPAATFVFDEVDAGVGGAAAIEIGRRLADLSRSCQVLVVTHLPQVAAFADHHVVVAKGDDGSDTISTVRPVQGADRVGEIARMLAGMTSSETAAAHAAELLETARGMRAGA